VAGCGECSEEPLGSGTMELISYLYLYGCVAFMVSAVHYICLNVYL
jgi:hypothetical protein